MIRQVSSGMIVLMLAKFMLNDVPHYIFSETTHRSIRIVPPTKRFGSMQERSGGSVIIKRTVVDAKMLSDLEVTWHRIESDMSYDMQKALGILKEIMGYYYEEPAVAAYKGSVLAGIAVYEAGRDKDLNINYTHIKELASFVHEPGVGRMLVDEVVKIAKGNSSDEVTVSYGAGAKGFYDKLGFKLYEGTGGETGALMVRKVKKEG